MNKNKIQDVLKQIKRIDISTKNKAYGSLSALKYYFLSPILYSKGFFEFSQFQ